MKCKEVAELLLKTPEAELLAKVADEWAEVRGVRATGQHRNAVTLELTMPDGPCDEVSE